MRGKPPREPTGLGSTSLISHHTGQTHLLIQITGAHGQMVKKSKKAGMYNKRDSEVLSYFPFILQRPHLKYHREECTKSHLIYVRKKNRHLLSAGIVLDFYMSYFIESSPKHEVNDIHPFGQKSEDFLERHKIEHTMPISLNVTGYECIKLRNQLADRCYIYLQQYLLFKNC